MTLQFRALLFAFIMACIFAGVSVAAPAFIGTTGTILTPSDVVLSAGDFGANYHIIEFTDHVTLLGASIGVTENLEIGVAAWNPDGTAETDTLINGKYRLLAETAATPSIVAGAVDVTGDLDPDDDPSLYVVAGKDLSKLLGPAAGAVGPLRVYVGVGGGIYNGVFGGLNWTISPRVQLMGEYINKLNIAGVANEESVFNFGLRLGITDSLRGDISLIDGDDLGFGLSYTRSAF